MYTITSGMSIKERVKTRAHKRDITKAIMMIFVIGVEKNGMGHVSTVQVNKRWIFIRHPK